MDHIIKCYNLSIFYLCKINNEEFIFWFWLFSVKMLSAKLVKETLKIN